MSQTKRLMDQTNMAWIILFTEWLRAVRIKGVGREGKREGERGGGRERGRERGGREGGHERAQWKDHTAWILCHAMFTRPFSAALAFPTSYDYKDQGWRYVEAIYTSSVRDTKVQVLLVYRAEGIWDQNWCPQLAADLRMQKTVMNTWCLLGPSIPSYSEHIYSADFIHV